MATLRRRPDRRSGEQRTGDVVHRVVRRLHDLAAVTSVGDRGRSIPLRDDVNPPVPETVGEDCASRPVDEGPLTRDQRQRRAGGKAADYRHLAAGRRCAQWTSFITCDELPKFTVRGLKRYR